MGSFELEVVSNKHQYRQLRAASYYSPQKPPCDKPYNQPRSQGLHVFGCDDGEGGPGKGWLSHDQIFQYIWKIFAPDIGL